MKKIFTLTILILLLSSSLIGISEPINVENIKTQIDEKYRFQDKKPVGIPDTEFFKQFGEYHKVDIGQYVEQTSDGGYIITGHTESYGASNVDIWLIKTDSRGSLDWMKLFGGGNVEEGFAVHQTSDNGYIIVGATKSFGAGNYDIWLIKTDSNGNKIWNKTFGGSDSDTAEFCEETLDGGFIIFGVTESYGSGASDIWLIRTDSDGNELWNKTFGGSDKDYCYEGLQLPDSSFVVIGETKSYAVGDWDAWLIKTDPYGNELLNRTYGSIRNDWGESIELTTDNGFIISGSTTSYGAGQFDFWLLKTDSNGNELWNKTYGGEWWDESHSVIQTIDGGYLIAGETESYGEDMINIWLVKTSSNGIEQWNGTFNGPLWSKCYSLQQTSDEGFIMTGYTSGSDVFYGNVFLYKIKKEPQEPDSPELDGPFRVRVNQEYDFNFSTIDPQNDDVYYMIKYDDIESVWFGPYPSGETAVIPLTFTKAGDWELRTKAKDENGFESDWSPPYPISVPRNKPMQSADKLRKNIMFFFGKYNGLVLDSDGLEIWCSPGNMTLIGFKWVPLGPFEVYKPFINNSAYFIECPKHRFRNFNETIIGIAGGNFFWKSRDWASDLRLHPVIDN